MKKLLYILTALLVLGGVAYGLTSSGLLQGSFSTLSSDKVKANTYASQADDFADLAEDYATLAQGYANDAYTAYEGIETAVCEVITMDPASYEIDADATEIEDFTIIVTTNSTSTSWSGSLIVETDGDGTVEYGGYEDSSVSIAVSSTNSETAITVSEAEVGDTISAYISGEEDCSYEIIITQAEPVEPDDSDGDGINDDDDSCPDEDATNYDNDEDGCIDDTDTDGDGLTDYEEVEVYETDPESVDTDEDGLTDYAEVITYNTDPNDTDTDDDGYSDYDEIDAGTDPLDDSDYPSSSSTTDEENTSDDNNEEEVEVDKTLEEAVDEGCSYEDFPFNDVSQDDYYYEWICYAHDAGIIEGKSRYTFAPDENTTRAELLAMLLRVGDYVESDASGYEKFADVDSSDWFYNWVRIGADIILKIDSTYMNPNNPITRGDAAIWLARLTGETLYGYTADDIPFSDLATDDPFTYAVLIAYNATTPDGERVIQGYNDGTYRPYEYISRGEAATIALRAFLAWYY